MENRRRNMWVCDRCLAAIESHEGRQPHVAHDIELESDNPDDIEESRCDWCDEVGFSTLYELI